MRRSPSFIAAERTRRLRRPASPAQRHTLAFLAGTAGIEEPHVFWSTDASDAIDRLTQVVREPTLGPMG